jgi:hypothetical protein
MEFMNIVVAAERKTKILTDRKTALFSGVSARTGVAPHGAAATSHANCGVGPESHQSCPPLLRDAR